MTPSSMILRKRPRKNPEIENNKPATTSSPPEADDEVNSAETQKQAALSLPASHLESASYVRFEIVEKKGQKILVPVRYSIRNQNLDTSFHAKEALEAVY